MAFWNRRTSIDAMHAPHDEAVHGPRLKKTLSWPHLLALGVGAIVGTGILTLIGVGAGLAGPAVLISFGLAGLVCACAALAYAELSTMMPAAGSAYVYSYAVLGELIAWVVGWSLILEYSLVVSAVAVGWSGYAVGFLNGLDIGGISLALPHALTVGPHAGGIVNLPAVFIIAVVTGLLLLGTRESANINVALVIIKIVALIVFVAIALPTFKSANFHPFMPEGFRAPFVKTGVMAAAAIIFFAFYGFDAISTAAEETKKPERDLAIGIVGSMLICTALYLVVAAAAIGARPVASFAASPEPLALILRELGQGVAAKWIGVSAVVALPTVLLAFLFGQSRIFLGMARDGLLPVRLAKISTRGVPALVTIFTAVVVAILAGLLPLDELASLANAGTLAAFCAVGVCLVVLRLREPGRKRLFKAPLWPLVAAITIVGCVVFFLSLKPITQGGFLIWNAIGLVIYFVWSSKNARLAKSPGDSRLMSRRDLSGAVDFDVLDRMTGGDDAIAEEVLGLFTEQAAMWSAMLEPRTDGWRDAVHTIRGAAAGIGAGPLAAICAEAEGADQALAEPALNRVRTALDVALADVAAWRHELMLRTLRAQLRVRS